MPEVSSNSKGLVKNADGSVDVYFGLTAPSGKESNWVQTVPEKFWFPYFRLYAPTQAYFDSKLAIARYREGQLTRDGQRRHPGL